MRINTAIILLAFCTSPVVANPAMEGDWMLEIVPTGAPIIGLLEVEPNGDNWEAFVEGGPAPVHIDGDSITVDIDSRDIRGFVFVLKLDGHLEGGKLSGSYTVESDAEVSFSPGTWSATRYTPEARPTKPAPVDLSGIWKPAAGVDMRKYSMDLTPAAKSWHDGYLMHYDQPNVRCISPGIVAMVAWASISMLPQVGIGGWTPRPKKLSDDSRMIALPTASVAPTTIGPITLGRMCRPIMRTLPAPIARAAST